MFDNESCLIRPFPHPHLNIIVFREQFYVDQIFVS